MIAINPLADLGFIDKGTEHSISWPYKGDPKDVEDIVPTCGCTASVTLQSEEIKASYRDNTTIPKNKIDSLPVDKEGRKYVEVSKTINVYLKDGKPLKTPNEKGVLVYNKDKAKVSLYVKAKVRI